MERRKKRVKGVISVEKLSIGKTENSLESVSKCQVAQLSLAVQIVKKIMQSMLLVI